MPSLTITIPDDADLGPAMKALSPMQRAFVYATVECGGNATNAAEAAGYCANTAPEDRRTNLTSIGSQLMRNPRVAAALVEEAQKRLLTGSFLAVEKLLQLVTEGNSQSIQLRAAQALMDRTGMGPKSEHKVIVEHTRTDKEIVARITEISQRLGIDPQKLLGTRAPAQEPIDAEFEELGDTTGLEDIL